ncbi:MAG: pilus assembly PilX family protein [bacterium]
MPQIDLSRIKFKKSLRKQSGLATLLTTIMILLGVTLITLNSSRLSSLELVISNNYESEHTAFNKSESGLDALFTVSQDLLDWNRPEGYSFCTVNDTYFATCDENTITPTNGWPTEFTTVQHQAQVVQERVGCAPRWLDTSCSGTVQFGHFTIRSAYNDTANKGSSSETVSGAMQLLF